MLSLFGGLFPSENFIIVKDAVVNNNCESGNCMRRYYLDNIRWATVGLVCVYHVVYMYNGIVTDGVIGPFYEKQYQDMIQYLLYPWFMLLLFLISGMCSRYYLEKHTIREFVGARTRRLLVPSTIGLLTAGWLQGYISMAISNAFLTLPDSIPGIARYFIMTLSGTGVLWFIQMLWLFSMLLAVFRTFEKGKLYTVGGKGNIAALVLLAVPVYLSGLLLNAPVVVVYRFGIYGFVFFLGYFVFAHEKTIACLCRYRILLLTSAGILAVIYLFLHYGDNFAVVPVVNSISAAAYGWIACLAILGCAKKRWDTMPPFASFMTKRSFGLYVFHYLPLSATAYALREFTSLPALPCYLLTAFAAFAGGFLLYEIVIRIPLLRWCLLGIRKGKKGKS